MNDLISRSALIEEYEWLKSQVNASSVPEIEEHIKRINNAPAVDAVEVVRCKDCKHYERGVCVCPYLCISGAACLYPQPEHFCSYGERRNGDATD